MLNCHDATRLLSESQERSLTMSERMSLKLHVMMCKGCENVQEQMGTLRSMMRSYAKRNDEQADKE